jgi:putative acetyltransferase
VGPRTGALDISSSTAYRCRQECTIVIQAVEEDATSTISSPNVCLRPEQPGDAEAVRQINVSAFDTKAEADLVDALRAAGGITLSAVTVSGGAGPAGETVTAPSRSPMFVDEVIGGEVVGHVLFSPVTVSTEKAEVSLLALGPVAVLPSKQRQGIGTLMISGCLEYLRSRGHRGVVVVGEPAYYRRFGFIQASRWGLACELEVPDENFMAMALTPGVLAGVSGTVRYRPEFGRV